MSKESTDISSSSQPRSVDPPVANNSEVKVTDPTPIALALFGFSLAVYGVRYFSVSSTTLAAGAVTVGLNYAVLAGAIAEAVVGFLAVIRGFSYPGYVTATFGIWLFGFYMLVTSGVANKEFTPDALGWYVLVLIVPVAIMAVPAFVHRHVAFMVAFIAILALLALLGLAYHDVYNAVGAANATKTAPSFSTPVTLLKTSAYFGFIAAIALWWEFAYGVYKATGVVRSKA